jgi:hypothetical protein
MQVHKIAPDVINYPLWRAFSVSGRHPPITIPKVYPSELTSGCLRFSRRQQPISKSEFARPKASKRQVSQQA